MKITTKECKAVRCTTLASDGIPQLKGMKGFFSICKHGKNQTSSQPIEKAELASEDQHRCEIRKRSIEFIIYSQPAAKE